MFRCFTLVLLVASAGLSATEPGQVRDVTVFLNGALVTRTVTVDAKVGGGTVLFDGLPGDLDENTVRARVGGGARARVVSVDLDEVIQADLVREDGRRLNTEIKRIEDDIRRLDDCVKVARLRLDFIASIGQGSQPKITDQLSGRNELRPSSWQEAWETIERGSAEALQAIHQAEIESRVLDAELVKTQREFGQVRSDIRDQYQAQVNFEAMAAGELTVLLNYAIDDAGWKPCYDAYLDTKSEELTITLVAEVSQNSGEDWRDVALTLAAALADRGAALPELDPWEIEFSRTGTKPADYGSSSSNIYTVAGLDETEPSVSSDSEYVSEYQVPSRSHLPSDGESHRFRIAEHQLPATVGLAVVPRLERSAHVTAEATYDGRLPLMPGHVLLFLDGAYKGTGAMPRVRPGGTAKLSFGIDHKILVAFSQDTEQRDTGGIISKKRRIERWSEARVLNSHSKAVAITLFDQLPVSGDELIQIEFLEASTSPSETDVDDKPGVLAWKHTVEAKQEFKIRFGYAVIFPEDRSIHGFW